MSTNKLFRNVHIYDGKLIGIFKPKNTYNTKEKKILFNVLLKMLDNSVAKSTVQIIINDLNHSNKGQNFQPENKINASDVLAEIMAKILDYINHNSDKYKDILTSLSEQLTDSKKLGICPSGRVTRLLQIWIAFCSE